MALVSISMQMFILGSEQSILTPWRQVSPTSRHFCRLLWYGVGRKFLQQLVSTQAGDVRRHRRKILAKCVCVCVYVSACVCFVGVQVRERPFKEDSRTQQPAFAPRLNMTSATIRLMRTILRRTPNFHLINFIFASFVWGLGCGGCFRAATRILSVYEKISCQ